MKTFHIETPIGRMISVADEQFLYSLEFVDCASTELQFKQTLILSERTAITDLLEKELDLYFAKRLTQFTIPLSASGSEFQMSVWAELQKVKAGETRTYAAIARSLRRPNAFRAVANANGANPIAIVIPCHRIINANGRLGGYAGGIDRKKWLLEHEKQL